MTPGMLPMPPRMITARAVIETRISKLCGKIEPIFEANSAPDRQPKTAPSEKASSL